MSTLSYKLSDECLRRIRANWSDCVIATPRWSSRLNQFDQDNLMQALFDLNTLIDEVGGGNSDWIGRPERHHFEGETQQKEAAE